MARDPADGTTFVFDLVDDDADDRTTPESPADAEGDEPGRGGQTAPGGAGPRRRVVTPVAAVLAIVLGTGVAMDGARDAARMERMRDAFGGVADLSGPLGVIWAWGGAVGPGEDAAGMAVLGDVLAFPSEGELVALRPATGEPAWTVPLGANPDCGPMVSSTWGMSPVSSVVCLWGTGADRTVVAVGPDGAASAARVLDAADARRYGQPHAGPDGTVLRARRVGPASAVDLSDARCDQLGSCLGTIETGRDLVLRAEDAVTGKERWSVTVPFRSTDVMQCTGTFEQSWGGRVTSADLDGRPVPDAFGVQVTPGLVRLYGCGIEAGVTPAGAVVGTDLEPGVGQVVPLAGGGFAGSRFTAVPRTTLYAADGDVVGEITGYPLAPRSTDETGVRTILTVDEPARRLRAYAVDGTPRWDITLQSSGQDFLAQVGDTAVITSGAGTVRGLDLATGEERWDWDGSDIGTEADGGYFGEAYALQAFTDGDLVLLVIEDDVGEARGLVALDATSGAVAWERAGGGAATMFDPTGGAVVEQGVIGELVAVDGHLLEVTARGVRGRG